MSTVTATVKSPGSGGRKFQVRGTAQTLAAARTELQTKLAGTVGTVLSVSESDSVSDLTAYPTAGVAVQYDDYTLQVRASASSPIRSIFLQNWTKAIELPNTDGEIDINNGLIQAFVAAYRDGAGFGGYSPISGHAVS